MRHLEEGEIHAWLDGALDAEEGRRVESHAAACPVCADAVADARGLIAGASRVLLALDSVPGGVIPGAGGGDRERLSRAIAERVSADGRRRSPWRFLTGRPARIAAGLLLMAGVGVVATRQSVDESMSFAKKAESDGQGIAMVQDSAQVRVTPASPAVAEEPQAAPLPPPPRVADAASAREERELAGIGAGAPAAASGIAAERGRRSDINETAPRGNTSPTVTVGASAAAAESLAKARSVAGDQARSREAFASAQIVAGTVPPSSIDSLARSQVQGKVQQQARVSESRIQLRAPLRYDSAGRPAGMIAGVVVGTDGRPIDAVSIQLAGTNRGTMTDSSGRFTLADVAPGTYSLDARRIGYEQKRLDDVRVGAGEKVETSVALATQVLQLQQVVVGGSSDPVAGARLPFSATATAGPGTCFALTMERPADMAAGQRDRTDAMIRLEPPPPAQATPDAARAGGGGGGGGGGRGGGARGGAATPPPSAPAANYVGGGAPATPAMWERLAGDSILVVWFDARPLEMRARIAGDLLRGTVASWFDSTTTRPTRVTGRRVPCG